MSNILKSRRTEAVLSGLILLSLLGLSWIDSKDNDYTTMVIARQNHQSKILLNTLVDMSRYSRVQDYLIQGIEVSIDTPKNDHVLFPRFNDLRKGKISTTTYMQEYLISIQDSIEEYYRESEENQAALSQLLESYSSHDWNLWKNILTVAQIIFILLSMALIRERSSGKNY